MQAASLLRSLLFLLLSHVLIFVILYNFPNLLASIEGQLPASLNGTLTAAMSVAVAGARNPSALLTRSLIFSNPSYRAGKPRRHDPARAYRFFLDHLSSIRRSLDPYKVATSSTRSFSSSSARSSATAAASSAIPHISLHIAASSSGKGRKFQRESSTYDYQPSNHDALGLQKGETLQQKRRGRPDSGQDAYFVSRVGADSNVTAFAIADGVGGWTEHGIDPADFSHGLCSHMAQISLAFGDKAENLSPKNLLKQGYQALVDDPDIQAGGTTACVGVVDTTGRMRIANLGDSGFVLLRLGKVHHYSDPQTHAFNTPYQMSLTPPDILRRAKTFGGIPLNDDPSRADTADHMLRHGDVLVLATDGLWDNLDAQDVLKIASGIMRKSGAWELSPSDGGYGVSERVHSLIKRQDVSSSELQGTLQATLAAAIVGEAKSASQNQKRDGPFAKALRAEYPGENWSGGKVDDIAVLVVVSVDPSRVAGAEAVKAKL
jgi:protein phosphatase PTC7